MANATKIVSSNAEARLSKLKNKRNQLENLLRSRERLEYEIKNLKKSVEKDAKQLTKESVLYEELSGKDEGLTDDDITEHFVLQEGVDSRVEIKRVLRVLSSSQDELIAILKLLLRFAEVL